MQFPRSLARTRASRAALTLTLLATGLTACGGGDDAAVDPPVTPSNLADCHNPSMYTLGSSWSVTWDMTHTDTPPGGTTEITRSEYVSRTDVLAPPPEWGMAAGVVRWRDAPNSVNGWSDLPDWQGRYVRLHDGVVDTLLTARWEWPTRAFPNIAYRGYLPGLSEPITLAAGDSYASTPATEYRAGPHISSTAADPAWRVAAPPLDGSTGMRPDKATLQTTYVGRVTLSVPAGTFATCHVRQQEPAGVVKESWRVAEGPWRGIAVQTREMGDQYRVDTQAREISAGWK